MVCIVLWNSGILASRRPHRGGIRPPRRGFFCQGEDGRLAKQKWTTWPETSSQFRGRVAIKFVKNLIRKRIRFYKNRRLAWDILTFWRSRRRLICLKQFFVKHWMFGVRRPHNFAGRVGSYLGKIRRTIFPLFCPKRAFGLETSSHFRAQISLKKCFSSCYCYYHFCFVLNKRAFGVRHPNNFAFSQALIICIIFQESFLSKNDVLRETSSQFRGRVGSIFWQKCSKRHAQLFSSMDDWLETSSHFRDLVGFFFFTKMDVWPETSSQFCDLIASHVVEKMIKMNSFSKTGVWAWDVLTFSRSRWFFFCLKMSKTDVSPETSPQFCWPTRSYYRSLHFKNGRLAWDILTLSRSNLWKNNN